MGGYSDKSLRCLQDATRLRGFDRLGDSELVALVLGNSGGYSGRLTAGELFERFGSLDDLEKAGINELMKFAGIGRAAAIRLKASFELGRRRLISSKERRIQVINGPEDVAELMVPEMAFLDREHFRVILMNTKNGILKIVTAAIGSLDAALVHPREIFKEAVITSAAGMIIVHNHPTGNPEPSEEDRDITERFFKCGKLMGIDLLDHVIIGGSSFVSMRERGLIYS